MQSWRPGTKKQYNTHIKRWFQYCSERETSPILPTLETVVKFLTFQYSNGLGYESLNTAKGALSALGLQFDGFRVENHPLIIRYMKGVFASRPSKPRYTYIWDVDIVLLYLKKLSPVKHLSLKDLTLKLVMLMALTQAARVHTLHLLNFKCNKKLKSEYVLQFNGHLKQSRPGHNVVCVSFRAYPPDRRLCVYTVLKEYLSRTSVLRHNGNSGKFFMSYVKPHATVTRDTISRWIKTVMRRAGINVKDFSSHSVRSVVTSKASTSAVPIADILTKAGWSRESTFRKFYDKPVLNRSDKFQEGILVDQQHLQEDIDNLCQWSKDWLLKFNVQKCKVVSFGRKRVDTNYHMTDRDGNIQQLKKEDSEKDLGVLFTESLSFEKHISNTLNKANMIIGLIRRKFTHIDNTLFLTLYKSLVRSHLDYGNLIYFPITKKCKQVIENAQRRAIRLIPDLRGLTYNDRLRKINLPSLDFRRKRFNMIQEFRIVHNIDDISMTTFFTFADNSGTRGHNLKLFKPKARKSLRQNSFSNRIVSTWNNLPHELVNTTSVNAFKAGLDKLWKNKRFDTSEVY
ncbi:hypothetical protein MAR_012295 [Mya arenaria]|uniref:Tyr recombinase domain-containing protein n=1 Tax=Mya arenaria TaxID=6604 RepID=A0ABY7G5L5_MYAAR|nr:hypothetical protein MAR_012295 [Mya arenaria]